MFRFGGRSYDRKGNIVARNVFGSDEEYVSPRKVFRFDKEFYDRKGGIVVRNVIRYCGDKCGSITEIDLKELDRDICRHETVSLYGLFKECR